MKTERKVRELRDGRVALVLYVDREEPDCGWRREWRGVYGPRDIERLADDLAAWTLYGAFALDGRAGDDGDDVVTAWHAWDEIERAVRGDIDAPMGSELLREAIERARIFCRDE